MFLKKNKNIVKIFYQMWGGPEQHDVFIIFTGKNNVFVGSNIPVTWYLVDVFSKII